MAETMIIQHGRSGRRDGFPPALAAVGTIHTAPGPERPAKTQPHELVGPTMSLTTLSSGTAMLKSHPLPCRR